MSEEADWYCLGFKLACQYHTSTHTPLTPCPACIGLLLQSLLLSTKVKIDIDNEFTHLEGMELAWALALPLNRVEATFTSVCIHAHIWEATEPALGWRHLFLACMYLHTFGRLRNQLSSVAPSLWSWPSLYPMCAHQRKSETNTVVQPHLQPRQRLPSHPRETQLPQSFYSRTLAHDPAPNRAVNAIENGRSPSLHLALALAKLQPQSDIPWRHWLPAYLGEDMAHAQFKASSLSKSTVHIQSA